MAKFYLWFLGLFWLLYGIAVSFHPAILTYVAQFDLSNWIVAAEVRAMYGGLEWGLGIFTLLGLCPAFDYKRAAILLNAILMTLLTLTRFAGVLIDAPDASALALTFGFDNIPQNYNSGALWCLELPMAIMGWVLVSRFKSEKW